jgi:hypothetical protein
MEHSQNELMQQALGESHLYGLELVDACSQIADCFQQGNQQEGVQMLSQFLEGVCCISQAVQLTNPVHQEKNLAIDLAQLPPVLQPLVEALEQKDYRHIGDILTYEMRPLLSQWTEELGKASGECEDS